MILFLAILYFGYHLIKESIEDVQMRDTCRSQGFDTYPSKTGMRDVKTNRRCYVNPRTGKKTFF